MFNAEDVTVGRCRIQPTLLLQTSYNRTAITYNSTPIRQSWSKQITVPLAKEKRARIPHRVCRSHTSVRPAGLRSCIPVDVGVRPDSEPILAVSQNNLLHAPGQKQPYSDHLPESVGSEMGKARFLFGINRIEYRIENRRFFLVRNQNHRFPNRFQNNI